MAVIMRFATLVLFAAAFFASTAQAPAQDYPTRIVHVIAPYGPGGPSDVYSRIVAQKLSDTLKQGFVVENRPGASTMIGTDAVAKAAPDGYTLLIISQTHATNESLVANKNYQLLRDFAPVSPIYEGDLVLVVPPINPNNVTPHTEAFQAVLWHALVTDPRLMKGGNKWETTVPATR